MYWTTPCMIWAMPQPKGKPAMIGTIQWTGGLLVLRILSGKEDTPQENA